MDSVNDQDSVVLRICFCFKNQTNNIIKGKSQLNVVKKSKPFKYSIEGSDIIIY